MSDVYREPRNTDEFHSNSIFLVVLLSTVVTAYLIVFARWHQQHKNG